MALGMKGAEVLIIQPAGAVNATNAVEFQQQLTKAIVSEQNSALLVDMERVESIDSAGLLALVAGLRLAQRRKRRFSLCSLAPAICMIFELTQLDQAFEIFDSRDACLAAIQPTQTQKTLALIG